jgi:hypothetical protein
MQPPRPHPHEGRQGGDQRHPHGAIEEDRGDHDRRGRARHAGHRRPRHHGGDAQRVPADAPREQDAARLRFDGDAPDLREREIDAGKREERSPAGGPGERPEHVDRQQASQHAHARVGEGRDDPRLALELRALGGVHRHVAAAQVKLAAALAPGHGDVRRFRGARVPASIAHGDHPPDERERSQREHPWQDAAEPPGARRRAPRRKGRHDSAPARASAGHWP